MTEMEKRDYRKKGDRKIGVCPIKFPHVETPEQLEFAVFCIENIAQKLKKNGLTVYRMFTEKSTILDDYILPEYEMLHTQSKEYIIDDILNVMKKRGVEV